MKNIFLILLFLPLYAQTQTMNISNNDSISKNPHIITCKSVSYVLWTDKENGNYSIQFRLSSNGSWSDVKKIDASHSINPSSFTLEDSTVLDILWVEGSGANNRLMYGLIEDSTLVDSVELFRNDSLNIVFSSCLYDQPTGTLHISWDVSYGDSIYTYYSNKVISGMWSIAKVIATNNSFNGYPCAQLLEDKNQDILCLWCSSPQFSSDSMTINMIRKNADSWIEGTRLAASGGIGRSFIARNDDSLNIHIVSLPGEVLTCPCNVLLYSKWNGYNWSTSEVVPRDNRNAYSTEQSSQAICFSKDGYPIISWQQNSWDMYLTQYAKFIGTSVKTDVGWHINTVITIHPNMENPSIAVDNQDYINYVWQDTSDSDDEIYFYKTSLLTKVRSDNNLIVPNEVTLYQNFPNPFNPSTTISYKLSATCNVSLKIFDLLGREVAELVSEKLQAGDHSVIWDASGMSSGIYFYRLQAGFFSETKALMLLK
jgi:hypothetical protein